MTTSTCGGEQLLPEENESSSFRNTVLDKVTGKFSPSRATGGAMMPILMAICMIEGADVQLLPASFRALEVNLGITPTGLATLGLAQAMAQWIFTPVWGALVDTGFSRKQLLACGAFSWGVLTMLLAVVSSYPVMLLLRTLNGMALGCLSPVSQSLIVDITHKSERGKYFGLTQFAANLGSVLCAVGTSTISNQFIQTRAGPVQGWRFAFGLVACASVVLTVAILLCMIEPVRQFAVGGMSIRSEYAKVCRYWRIPTFKVLVLQGMFGCIPWSSMSFLIFYFQYIGMSDFRSSVLFGASMVGGALGGILGGLVGDRLSLWSGKHGRPLTAQISVFAGIPLITAILWQLPRDSSYFGTYLVTIFVFGLTASWCATGVNRPILAEIVEERDRASVFAWMITIDGTFASLLGAPVVGMLAEHVFGYQPSQQLISEMPIDQREMNAVALSHALMACCIIPWVLCFICFSFLHITYAQDVAGDKNGQAQPATASLVARD
mmetsp:Transcript_18955/g.29910  ORF Transcript_18955/g.29910 Transcript_18955/m.29910 type:complete len:494 (+) Transcript_18955:185-1666(+)